MLVISPIYAGLIALLFLYLSFRVIGGRLEHRISVGDGENIDMVKRMRVQANCAEYAPFGLILLGMAELQGTHPHIVHALGLSLLAGRFIHAYGLGRNPQNIKARKGGMFLTIGMIAAAAVINIL